MATTKSPVLDPMFERDPSVDQIIGPIPHRAIYAKMPTEALSKGRIKSGTHVVEGISIFWNDPDVNVDFQLNGHDLTFSFSRVMSGYFALSWSLNGLEIERLKSNQILSLHMDAIQNSAGNSIRADIGSRMTYIKGRDERQIMLNVNTIQNRIVTAAALNESGMQFSAAYRIWLDLIITNARSKTLIFKNPMLVLQEQLLL